MGTNHSRWNKVYGLDCLKIVTELYNLMGNIFKHKHVNIAIAVGGVLAQEQTDPKQLEGSNLVSPYSIHSF